MTRKYKQRGYQEYEREKPQQRKRDDNDNYRKTQVQRVAVRVFKCSLCGNEIKDTSTITVDSQCPKCQSDLHSCVNCGYFDTSLPHQCNKKIPRNISPKDKRNECQLFMTRSSVEHRFVNVESQHDARKEFENLFKK